MISKKKILNRFKILIKDWENTSLYIRSMILNFLINFLNNYCHYSKNYFENLENRDPVNNFENFINNSSNFFKEIFSIFSEHLGKMITQMRNQFNDESSERVQEIKENEYKLVKEKLDSLKIILEKNSIFLYNFIEIIKNKEITCLLNSKIPLKSDLRICLLEIITLIFTSFENFEKNDLKKMQQINNFLKCTGDDEEDEINKIIILNDNIKGKIDKILDNINGNLLMFINESIDFLFELIENK